ncbi:MAG: S41 family peptidase [Candidatus Omnitrophota bacterium]
MFLKRKRTTFLIVLFVCVLFFSGTAIKIDRGVKDETYKELTLFADALTLIQSQYVDESKPKDLIYGALKGMLSSLDPYSEFLSPEEYKDLKADTEGRFGGVGMEITLKDGLVTVVSPLEDTPAWEAGVKAGDKIVKIDDKIIKDYTLTDAVKLLRGEPGTEVKITAWRQKEKKMLDFKILRAIIKIEEIKDVRIIDEVSKIGYIRLVEFSEETQGDLNNALDSLSEQGVKGLILDVRNNPGGLLDVAARVTEKFLDKNKVIVTTKGRGNLQNLEFRSKFSSKYKDLPMVVLINEGSASGSEILAGALQDHKRAIVVGEKSFGKGSVQTVIPLADDSALKLTTSKYFTPLGRSIHGEGIMPDIEIKYGQIEKIELEENELPEAITKTFEEEEEGSDDPFIKRYKRDNQLIRAVDILKGVLIYNQPQA